MMGSQFHFLRPEWFLALLPLALLYWLLWRKRLLSRSWQAVVDARLLPHLLIGDHNMPRRAWPFALLGLGGVLAITALAGPVWQKLEQPVFRQQSGLIVALDLSRSMDATDVRPSRLARARLKLIDILNQHREGQTALIAYAATPFVVTPLTSDSKTIIAQLPSMTTELMPAQGSRPDRAIALARQLLQQSAVTHGSVLLITDGAEGHVLDALSEEIKQLRGAGHRLLVLGVGTATGAPIPQSKGGGFVTNGGGAIVVPKLDDGALAALAREGSGLYRHLEGDDSDINALLAQINADSERQRAEKVNDMMSDQWQEEGVWLLLPLLLLAAFAFRRGYLAAVVLAIVILPQPQSAFAFDLDWETLWSNSDQQAQRAFERGDHAKAVQLFTQPQWRAAAEYRAGDYENALESLAGIESADGYYNRGNALAKLGRLPEAISAYDEALKRDPKMEDAIQNRDLVKHLLEQQQQKSQQDKSSGNRQDSQSQQQQQGAKDQSESDSGSDAQNQFANNGKRDKQQENGKESPQQQRQDDSAKSDTQPSAQQQAGQEEQQKDQQQPPVGAQQQLSSQQREEQRANEQWLQRIPDDPGGLWRRKFLYQYQKQQQMQGQEERAW